MKAKAFYIDTERGFSSKRLIAIASRFNLNPEEALENIFNVYAVNTDHLISLLKEVEKLAVEEDVKLIVIDSLTTHFRREYSGRENLLVRQQLINRFLGRLMRLAFAYNLVVAVTNHVMLSPDPREPFERAVGGHIVGHGTTHRIWLYRRRGPKRLAKVVDSPRLPEAEAWFEIGDGGIYDSEPD